jgi:hypothetical protein
MDTVGFKFNVNKFIENQSFTFSKTAFKAPTSSAESELEQ